MNYSHEVRIQTNELEPKELPYILLIERINDMQGNDFLHIMPVKLFDEDIRNYKNWSGIEGKHFALALPGIGFRKGIK